MHHDPETKRLKLEGLVARYRAGEFGTVVFTASLIGMRMPGYEIADLISDNIIVHQRSLPYRRGEITQ